MEASSHGDRVAVMEERLWAVRIGYSWFAGWTRHPRMGKVPVAVEDLREALHYTDEEKAGWTAIAVDEVRMRLMRYGARGWRRWVPRWRARGWEGSEAVRVDGRLTEGRWVVLG